MERRHRTAVFTIVSRNYWHYARVLMGALQVVSPEWDRFVVLADRIDGAFDPTAEIFETVEAHTLPFPEASKFIFRYTILEFNTAVKPWFFRQMFAKGYDRVVYLDPDIFVYAPLLEVERALTAGSLAVLVPHLTGRIRDAAHPGELEILQSGAYNLGFCALARHPDLEALLEFWCEKSVRDFVVDLHRGLFTDQRWMDLVPGMFPDVTILRHEGYDVAYWNLPHRHLVRAAGGGVLVNGAPLVFFHFSGVDPLNPSQFSKHQNRYRLGSVGVAGELAEEYCGRLHDSGSTRWRQWPYAYGSLRDGSPIPDVLRTLYRTTPDVESWAGSDPFARSCTEWNEPLDGTWPPLTRVMLAVHQARPDLRLGWPDPIIADRAAFARWFAQSVDVQELVASCYIDPIRQALGHAPAAARTAPRLRRRRRLTLRPELMTSAFRKAAVAVREGRLPMSPRRWLHLYRLHVSEAAQAALPPLPPVKWPARAAAPKGVAGYTGFHPQSAEEAAAGLAWMGITGTIRIVGGKPGATVVIRGEHWASAHEHVGQLKLSFDLDGTPLAWHTLHDDGPFEITFILPFSFTDQSLLQLHASQVFVPARRGMGDDTRQLSVQIRSIEVNGHPLLDFGRSGSCFQPQWEQESPEVTIVGYLSDGTGVATGAHASAAACRDAGIIFELIDARPSKPVRGTYAVSLLHVNADQMPLVAGMLGEDFFRGRYTIGIWAWELEAVPDAFLAAFEWVDEIWASSMFIQRAVAERSPVPVVHMPYPVTLAPLAKLHRRDFGLPEGAFVFLTMYDALSVQERKNPFGAIAAFRRAFPDAKDVALVVKVNHARSRPAELAHLRREIAGTNGVLLFDRPTSRAEAQALQASCDAFVSLHRSEGFGFNIAEAMLLGKPVIATAWSGNLDFTTHRNACLVDYELVELSTDHGPYRKGNRWAQPDVDHAAEFMMRLVEDAEFRRTVALQGQATIASDFTPLAIGRRYLRRLAAIRRRPWTWKH